LRKNKAVFGFFLSSSERYHVRLAHLRIHFFFFGVVQHADIAWNPGVAAVRVLVISTHSPALLM
jgi:hypothetical protein